MKRDISFNNDNLTANTTVRSIAVQDDNTIVIGGDFTKYNGIALPANGIVTRLNSDGTIDGSFTPPLIEGGVVWAIAAQPWDHKIVIAGEFNKVDGVSRNHIARLNTDGSLDLSFDPGTGTETKDEIYAGGDGKGAIYSLLIQDHSIPSKRRIYLGGAFDTYNGVTVGTLTRVNESGIRDASYDPQVNHGAVFSMCLDKANRLIIGGEFWNIGSTYVIRVARLTTAGANDGTFSHDWISGTVSTVAVDNYNNILVGGKFTWIGSTSNLYGAICRFTSTGVLDPTFNTQVGAKGGIYSGVFLGTEVSSIYVKPDDVIFVGGNFNSFNGTPCGNIIPLNNDGSVITTIDFGSGFNYPIKYITVQSFGPTDVKYLIGAYDLSLSSQSTYRSERQGNIIRVIPTYNVLPTRLISYKATRDKENVKITWKTATQESTETIRIKRSSDGRNFTTIKNLRLEQALQADHSFLFTDSSIPNTELYYKIQFMSDSVVRLESGIMLVRSAFVNKDEVQVVDINKNDLTVRTNFNNADHCNFKLYSIDGKLYKTWNSTIQSGESNQIYKLPALTSRSSLILTIDRQSDHKVFTFKLLN